VFLLSNEHNSLGTQCGMRKAGCAGCGMCRKPFQSVERFRYSSDRHQVIAHALHISRNTSRGKNREDKNGHLRTERLPLSDLESTRAVAKFSQSRVWNKVSVRSDLIFFGNTRISSLPKIGSIRLATSIIQYRPYCIH